MQLSHFFSLVDISRLSQDVLLENVIKFPFIVSHFFFKLQIENLHSSLHVCSHFGAIVGPGYSVMEVDRKSLMLAL